MEEAGLKTTYYLRSAACDTHPPDEHAGDPTGGPDGAPDAVACSLENPESCEACQ